MDIEMCGVIARIQELIDDLSSEYQSHLDEPEVTERAKNLFHESLVKMRSALDMAMNRIWKKHVGHGLSDSQLEKKQRDVHFPICDTKEKFDARLQEMGLRLSPDDSLYDLLLQSQPFQTKQSTMAQLRDLGNLGKHQRLAQQHRKSRPATRVQRPDGSVMVVEPPLCDDALRERFGDAIPVEEVSWVEFVVEGQPISEPVILCRVIFTGLQTYLEKLLTHT